MRIAAMLWVMIMSFAASGSAATIDLTDGSSIQGDIAKKDAKSVQINVDGVTMTYYADEIKDIDGKSFAQVLAGPVSETLPAQPNAESQPDTGEIDPDKKALILKFIDVFGTRQALSNNFKMMIGQIEKEKPDEAQKIRQRVKVDEIIERLVPVYDRNFNSEDLKAYIDFYGSPQGQKLIKTIPVLMKESVQESVKYMQEKFPEVDHDQQ